MSRVQELIDAALLLDPAELEELLRELAERLTDPPISPAWLDAARRRSEQLASGASQAIPWAEVRERMYRRVNGSQH